ncbi:MAG: 50S ribosomal protein L13 [Clostridia bacterium]
MKTFMQKTADVKREWFVVDGANIPMGRVATTVTNLLSGKGKTTYTPHVDGGDYVIVVNSDKLVLTGNKLEQKEYIRHTGFVGGLKRTTYKELMETKSDFALQKAVKGMLPKTSIGRKQITRLYVYKGEMHDQEAQKPKLITVKGVN